jgi:hypothetical protein
MEAAEPSETLRHISEDRNLNIPCSENLKSQSDENLSPNFDGAVLDIPVTGTPE